MFPKSLTILLIVAFLETLPVNADGLYTKNSPVLQVDAKNYDRLIAQSNHTSVSKLAKVSEIFNRDKLISLLDLRVRYLSTCYSRSLISQTLPVGSMLRGVATARI